MPQPTKRDLAQHELEHDLINLDSRIQKIAQQSQVVNVGGSGGVRRLSDMTDVDLSTTPTDTQVLYYSDAGSYQASLSPLAWGGNDYKAGNLGVSSANCIVFLISSTPAGITADGTTIDNEDSTSNIHVALVDLPGGGGKSTFYISDGVASTAAALEAIIQADIDPTGTVDNFKADYLTYNAGASYTFTGLTGFDQAGAVTVVSGDTNPPTITFIPGDKKWKATTNYKTTHFSCGIYGGEGDTAQSINNNTATVIDLSTRTLFADSYFTVNSSSVNFQVGAQVVGGIGVISLTNDSNDLISSAKIEWQHDDSSVWNTRFVGLGGSLTFPIDDTPSGGSSNYRVRVTQTSGGAVSVYCRLDIYYTKP